MDAALERLDQAVKDLTSAWNTSEGRRGRIAENRRLVAEEQKALEEEREALRQEQWRLRKESTTLQHARDEAERMGAELETALTERTQIQERMRLVLTNLKLLQKELRR